MSIDWTQPLVVAGTDRVATVVNADYEECTRTCFADWDGTGEGYLRKLGFDTPRLTNAPPTPLIAEHRAALARVAELEEGWKTLLKIIEKSVHPKEPPHRMIFADDHIETGRAVDAYVRMMQKMQTVARAALEPKP